MTLYDGASAEGKRAGGRCRGQSLQIPSSDPAVLRDLGFRKHCCGYAVFSVFDRILHVLREGCGTLSSLQAERCQRRSFSTALKEKDLVRGYLGFRRFFFLFFFCFNDARTDAMLAHDFWYDCYSFFILFFSE